MGVQEESVTHMLGEARLIYDREEERRRELDSKLGASVAACGAGAFLVAGHVWEVPGNNSATSAGFGIEIGLLVALCLFVIGALIGWYAYGPKDFQSLRIADLVSPETAQQHPQDTAISLAKGYRNAIEGNQWANGRKIDALHLVIGAVSLGVVALGIAVGHGLFSGSCHLFWAVAPGVFWLLLLIVTTRRRLLKSATQGASELPASVSSGAE